MYVWFQYLEWNFILPFGLAESLILPPDHDDSCFHQDAGASWTVKVQPYISVCYGDVFFVCVASAHGIDWAAGPLAAATLPQRMTRKLFTIHLREFLCEGSKSFIDLMMWVFTIMFAKGFCQWKMSLICSWNLVTYYSSRLFEKYFSAEFFSPPHFIESSRSDLNGRATDRWPEYFFLMLLALITSKVGSISPSTFII